MDLGKEYKNLIFSEENNVVKLIKSMELGMVLVGHDCMSSEPKGFNKKINNLFGTKYFENEKDIHYADINKLGNIEVKYYEYDGYVFLPNNLKDGIIDDDFTTKLIGVGILYTQYESPKNGGIVDYDALRICLRKINHLYAGTTIGLPIIGKSKGDVLTILAIMDEELTDVKPIVINK